jgi:choline dehydrogenase-like flavoprotein
MTTDAVVIGSGPGGAAAADVLTEAGWTVVIVEKGRNHLLDPQDPERLLEDFSNDELKFVHRHFLGPDPLVEPRTFRTGPDEGEHSVVGAVNSIPSTVGGGGVHADGKVPRFREEDFALLATLGPVDGAAVADWPVDYVELEPYYAAAERRVGVAGDAAANPLAAWRSGPYPMAPGPPMYGATLSAAAAERLGLHPYPAPTAANSIAYGGRPACNNCGFCAQFGCPIHAKGDPVAMLQRALASGRAELLAETFACRIRTNGRRATGVEVVGADGRRRTLGARAVVLAGGAVETPRLLLLSGWEHPFVGRHLMVHFQTIAFGVLDQDLHAERGRAVTHVHDDAVVVDADARRVATEAGLPWLRGGMVEHTGTSLVVAEAKRSPWGSRHKPLMRASPMRRHLWAFTMQGEDLPQPTNTVDLDPAVRDAWGFPVARLTYRPHRHELAASAHHRTRLLAVLADMGAASSGVVTSPAVPGELGWEGPHSAVPDSRHVMGTTRMGPDPATSVVDPFGRLHGLENVVVADSSVFVTSAGYGPTLTLVALAMRAASALAGSDAIEDSAVE